MTDFACDYPTARFVPSPNHGERAGGLKPDMIILHYTGMETAAAALDWLCRDESQVSSHYFVHEDGRVDQLVAEDRRAWHAGKSSWKGETDINSRSIGIEIANAGHPGGLPDFPSIQIDAVVELCRNCGERWSITPERVLAHSDIAPIRKVDPGEKFPWERLHTGGVGHWVPPAPIGGGRFFQRGDQGQPVEAVQTMLSLYGYGIEVTGVFCEKTEGAVAAFQRHFRPAQVDGIADISTLDTLHRLLSTLPDFSR
ncbi:N-acetylmuramoyl-L-alanine amidase [Rhizobium sp. LjRoot98]|uniref:N-acetylmuramoyl-L-alanine amidase n=1 Tax=unclassified Rhizobium TaxID=2613769 RepID=UPI000713B139|nr:MULTISPECIES: N-acetylmuramoyl-L-alanine amidase [unclassified Rhizobium]KQV28784.1 N-acetylmuramoyl-L-alanine amidase [Rhizobium sp. Root1204]KQY05271.1 N-acetylmuramoyl-L-alanine amidase [Rhizobium sp. Root1334]KRC01890.1 N-acetylmuramoyl-L-alanine amidase [Rhizobium sp. Root73]